MSDPVLELDDIQGNIVAGFNTDVQVFVALTLAVGADAVAAARWVGGLSEAVTTVSEVRGGRAAMRSLAVGAEPWLAVALSQRLIEAAQPMVALFDEPFRRGMVGRAQPRLGDTTDPHLWRVGGTSAPVDVLLIVASNDEGAAGRRADDLVADASRVGLTSGYRETGRRLAGEREHFGFRDGLSQPRLNGDDGHPDTWLGHILFAYPTDPDGSPVVPATDPIELTHNGSLLVFRRLVQNVAAFHTFCRTEAERLTPAWPGLTKEWLGALIVGRWPSGAPADLHVPTDPGTPDNAFDFSDDLDGKRCPLGAHIRKVNPRNGIRDQVTVPRLVRRGIPFQAPPSTDAPDGERGLLFVAYQASIKLHFEFLSGSWMNNPTLPHPAAGHDVLVGRDRIRRSFVVTGPNGPVTVTHEGPEWITPTGGAYLFAPGRRGLAMLRAPKAGVASLGRASADALSSATAETRPPGVAPERDGETAVARSGPDRSTIAARWPLTRLAQDSAAALGELAHVERLDLSGQHFPTQIVDAADVRRLAGPGLAELALHGVSVIGESLVPAVSRMTSLKAADLRGVDLRDEDVGALVRSRPELVTLALGLKTPGEPGHRFDAARLTAGVWAELGRLPALRELSLRGVPLDDALLLGQSELLARLEVLDLGESGAGDGVARHLAQHGRLRRLALDETRLSTDGASALAELRTLDDLDISWTDVRDAGIEALLTRGDPSRLAMRGVRVSPRSLEAVASAEHLRDLDVSNTPADQSVVVALASLPCLERLSLARTAVTSSGVAALEATAIRWLDVQGVQLDEAAVASLSRMRGLREVRLSLGNEWEGLARIDAIVDLTALPPRAPTAPPRLRTLRLFGEPGSALARALGRLDALATLEVSAGADVFSEADDSAFGALQTLLAERAGLDDVTLDRLGALPRLEALFVSGNPLSASVGRLGAPYLHTIELRDTEVDDRAIEALASLPRLHCLDLPGTRVTPGGVTALLAGARNLQSLALDGTQLTAASTRALADAPALLELYLYGGRVTDDVLGGLRPLQRLRELNLFDTIVTGAVIPHLAALAGLRTLRLNNDTLSAAAVDALRRARPDLRVYAPGVSALATFPARASRRRR